MYFIFVTLCLCMLTLCHVHCQVDEVDNLKSVELLHQLPLSDSNYTPRLEKRSTMLLDRLVFALQKALKQETEQVAGMELQRRRPGGRVYWRCYFNAVSCFRRKK